MILVQRIENFVLKPELLLKAAFAKKPVLAAERNPLALFVRCLRAAPHVTANSPDLASIRTRS